MERERGKGREGWREGGMKRRNKMKAPDFLKQPCVRMYSKRTNWSDLESHISNFIGRIPVPIVTLKDLL